MRCHMRQKFKVTHLNLLHMRCLVKSYSIHRVNSWVVQVQLGKWTALREDIQRFMQTILIGATLAGSPGSIKHGRNAKIAWRVNVDLWSRQIWNLQFLKWTLTKGPHTTASPKNWEISHMMIWFCWGVVSTAFITEICGQLFGPKGLGIAGIPTEPDRMTEIELEIGKCWQRHV